MKELLDADTISAVMRLVASKRRRQDTTCAVCGVELRDVMRKRRYCGATCRKRAQLQRRRAQPADA